jgi:hypothetical protein
MLTNKPCAQLTSQQNMFIGCGITQCEVKTVCSN